MKLKKPPPIWLTGRSAKQPHQDHPAKPHRLATHIPDPDAARIWRAGRNGMQPNWVIPNKGDPIGGQMLWNDTVVTVEKPAVA